MTFSMDILEGDFLDCCFDFKEKTYGFHVEFSDTHQLIAKKLGPNYEWGTNLLISENLFSLYEKLIVLANVLSLLKEKEVCKLSRATQFLDNLLKSYYRHLNGSLDTLRAIQRNSAFSLQVDLSRNCERLIEKQLKLVGDYYESDEDE